MTAEPDGLVLIYLRRSDERVDHLIEDVHDVKSRMTVLEENLAGVQRRIDRLELGVEQIKRRLDLVATPH